MPPQLALPSACSAVAVASFGTICTASAGPIRQIAGLSLIAGFACAIWLMHRTRFDAIVPTIGLTLAFLILGGLALAAAHTLTTVPVALALTVATLAAAWADAAYPAPRHAERTPQPKEPDPLAVIGILVFAAMAVLAVHYSAASATTNADGASSVALWAYPSGGQLHVGVEQPRGRGAASLRIVVSQAGVTVATWNDIHVAPGQTWNAPALTVTGSTPTKVVALHNGTVVASLSSQ